MAIEETSRPDPAVRCAQCQACCCRQEAMLFNDTGIPVKFIKTDSAGRKSMARRSDGWCAALDRSTLRCTIYRRRPWICREFEMGGDECLAARRASLPRLV